MGCISGNQKNAIVSPLAAFSPGVLMYHRVSPNESSRPYLSPSLAISKNLPTEDKPLWISSCVLPSPSLSQSASFFEFENGILIFGIVEGEETQPSQSISQIKDLFSFNKDNCLKNPSKFLKTISQQLGGSTNGFIICIYSSGSLVSVSSGHLKGVISEKKAGAVYSYELDQSEIETHHDFVLIGSHNLWRNMNYEEAIVYVEKYRQYCLKDMNMYTEDKYVTNSNSCIAHLLCEEARQRALVRRSELVNISCTVLELPKSDDYVNSSEMENSLYIKKESSTTLKNINESVLSLSDVFFKRSRKKSVILHDNDDA